MSEAKTIAEATAKCPNVMSEGTYYEHLCDLTACTCNGTGYACGVRPTEVQLKRMEIVEAARWLIDNDPGWATNMTIEFCVKASCQFTPTVHVGRYLEKAEHIAVTGAMHPAGFGG